MNEREKRLAKITASREQRVNASIAAGKSFGRLWYLNNRGMTIEQAEKFAIHLHPKSPLFASVYKRSFVEAFVESRQRDLNGEW